MKEKKRYTGWREIGMLRTVNRINRGIQEPSES